MKNLLVLLILLSCAAVALAEDYKLVKKESNITIHERWMSRNGAKVRELKVVYYAKTNINEVVALLKNEDAGPKWNGRAEKYNVLPKERDTWVNYIKYDIPFPIDDQDWCLQYYYPRVETSSYAEIFFESITDSRFPATKDTKRITGVKGKWLVEEAPGGNVKITYTISSNRDSSIPKWISDPVIHNTILETMNNFKNLLETNVYE